MGTHAAIGIGLTIYACVMLAFSGFWMRRTTKSADYMIGGRNFPFWVLTGTITAGCIGTGVIVGASGLAYKHGWAGSAYPIGLGLGTALTGLGFAVMRRYRFMTLSEEITSYYGGNRIVAEFSNISLFLSQLCWLTVQIMGAAAVLAAVTTLPIHWCVVIAGCIAAGIAIPGGLKSVVYTDFIQAIILLCGFAVLTHSALTHSGGLAGLRHAVPVSYFSFLGVASYGQWKVAGLLVALILAVVADPGRRLTMYSARSEEGARGAMIIAGLIVIVFSVVIGIAGMYAFKLAPNLKDPDEALLWLVMNVLPAWLAALVVVSVASGIVSCASWNAMTATTFFVRHIYPLATGHLPRRPLLTMRLTLVGAFLVAIVMAMHAGTIVGFVVKFLPITMSGLAIIILLGRFWKRATWQGAVAALVITPTASLLGLFAPASVAWLHNALVPTVVGVAGHVLVSSLTPPTQRSFQDVVTVMQQQRQGVEGESPATVGPSIGAGENTLNC